MLRETKACDEEPAQLFNAIVLHERNASNAGNSSRPFFSGTKIRDTGERTIVIRNGVLP